MVLIVCVTYLDTEAFQHVWLATSGQQWKLRCSIPCTTILFSVSFFLFPRTTMGWLSQATFCACCRLFDITHQTYGISYLPHVVAKNRAITHTIVEWAGPSEYLSNRYCESSGRLLTILGLLQGS